YWPKEKITKGQLLEFYQHVAPFMLPHLRDRPQSLNRHPNGITGTNFFQKEVSGAVPGWMETATIGSGRSGKTVTYALCQTESDLLFLANMGCIEINTWLSRVGAINSPDFIVFDLDPGKIEFDAVIEVARAVKKILDKLKAPAYCKTSGSRGLHIYVPIKDATSFDEARIFAQQLSQEVHRLLPDTTSLERSPDRRTHKIYLDYLQNRIGQTMAAVYSVRPKPNATVSTPLRWSEVKPGLDPGIFTIATLPKRLARLGDLWADMAAAAVSLPEKQKELDALTHGRKKMPKPAR
ncbi:MAG: non-homologous end-joining DNA ligase, partial [Pseudobdellovibrionaceae bacterium]|nr:non-homologous end-joining DNA ligase [Pseudobdellovibrionaceae bacterium]